MILIISFRGDLHANVIRHELNGLRHGSCSILEFDRIVNSGSLHLSLSASNTDFTFLDDNGIRRSIKEYSVIWWRRIKKAQNLPSTLDLSEGAVDLINNDSMATLQGSLEVAFDGLWVNSPWATARAENKVVQLDAARKAGFLIPQTIISQHTPAIRDFAKSFSDPIIIKTVKGTSKDNLYASEICPDDVVGETFAVCPAIYQEQIQGERHLRVQVFGSQIIAVELRSKAMDWRSNHNIPAQIVELEHNLIHKLRTVSQSLELRMGIFDIKVGRNESPIWLEVNPQGQFLFLEPMTGFDFKASFSRFLLNACDEKKALA